MNQPVATTGHVYISHAPEDANYTRKLAAFLDRSGVPARFETDFRPDPVVDAVRRRIDDCSAVVVVMTPGANASDQVQIELDLAEERGKPIYPLLLNGRRFFRLSDLEYHSVTGGQMPPDAVVEPLAALVGGAPVVSTRGTRSDGPTRWIASVAAVVIAVALAGGAYALTRDRTTEKEPPNPVVQTETAGASPSPSAPASAGTVAITSPTDQDVVNRCLRVEGKANLDPGKTMLFANNRTDPPDATFYFAYVGTYRNGFVPAQWSGTVYLGSTSRQSYDLFVIVMDVAAAQAFWAAHQSKDGSYAAAPAIPADATRAALVRVKQGTTDGC